MPSDVTPEQFQHLATRTDILEREVEGEKMVTRHILEQSRRNGDDLAGVKTRLDGVETRLDRVENKLDGLTSSIPRIVGDVVREAFREERERKG